MAADMIGATTAGGAVEAVEVVADGAVEVATATVVVISGAAVGGRRQGRCRCWRPGWCCRCFRNRWRRSFPRRGRSNRGSRCQFQCKSNRGRSRCLDVF